MLFILPPTQMSIQFSRTFVDIKFLLLKWIQYNLTQHPAYCLKFVVSKWGGGVICMNDFQFFSDSCGDSCRIPSCSHADLSCRLPTPQTYSPIPTIHRVLATLFYNAYNLSYEALSRLFEAHFLMLVKVIHAF
jgi:hypothetical protein